MARAARNDELPPVLDIAEKWIKRSLIDDRSTFSDENLWTLALVTEVHDAFVNHPDEGDDSYLVKLKGQLSKCSPAAKRLAAEIHWAMMLFPSNINESTKLRQVRELWSEGGTPLPDNSPFLEERALAGIGSGGPGYNNQRYLELAYFLDFLKSLKNLAPPERARLLGDYDAFTKMLSAAKHGNRQLRHMLRYFAFPDRVERMSSNNDRRQILEAFGIAAAKETRKWSDKQLDDAMLALRNAEEAKYPGRVLDFYESPLVETWKKTDAPVAPPKPPQGGDDGEDEPDDELPRNMVFYGPPGTGKTYRLQQMFKKYTDEAPSTSDDEALVSMVAEYGWRPVIVVALARAGRWLTVPELRQQPLILAKIKERNRVNSIAPTLWSFLQTHTPESVLEVKVKERRAPFVFTKKGEGWRVVPNWAEEDSDAVELHTRLAAPDASPTKRYMVVTFHPSFSYEEFIRGIRPVEQEDGDTRFELVEGKFLQICNFARANPDRRYALFIDEINRANIAKVFGELITLIETDKRATYSSEGKWVAKFEVELPGGRAGDAKERPFSVPANLDIFGTMNTADRSIALLDIALRRRFQFVEIEPDYELLNRLVEGVDLGKLLKRINDRLEYLLDRDHRIGHAYLINVDSLEALRWVFADQIIPLLREYFFDDASKVGLVLRTSHVASFVIAATHEYKHLFGEKRSDGLPGRRDHHGLTPPSAWLAESFVGIYGGNADSQDAAKGSA